MRNDWGQQAQRAIFRGGTPLTIGILIIHVVFFFLALGFRFGVEQYLVFRTPDALVYPWTVVTWPLGGVDLSPLSLLFSIGWFYLFSGSLERAWGTRDYGLFFAAMAGLSASGLWIGSALLNFPAGVAGLWAISGPLAVAWAVLNRRERIGIFFVQVPAPFVAALGAVMLWYYAGAGAIGLFALVSCAAAYWYATQGRHSASAFGFAPSRGTSRRPDRSDLRPDTAARFRDFDRERSAGSGGWNPLRWWKDRQERKRLEAIFRRSGFTDDDKR